MSSDYFKYINQINQELVKEGIVANKLDIKYIDCVEGDYYKIKNTLDEWALVKVLDNYTSVKLVIPFGKHIFLKYGNEIIIKTDDSFGVYSLKKEKIVLNEGVFKNIDKINDCGLLFNLNGANYYHLTNKKGKEGIFFLNNQKYNIPAIYDKVEMLVNNEKMVCFLIYLEGKVGLCLYQVVKHFKYDSESGIGSQVKAIKKHVISPVFDCIDKLSYDTCYFKITLNGKTGVLNGVTGKILLAPIYDYVYKDDSKHELGIDGYGDYLLIARLNDRCVNIFIRDNKAYQYEYTVSELDFSSVDGYRELESKTLIRRKNK